MTDRVHELRVVKRLRPGSVPHLLALLVFMVTATTFLWPSVSRQQIFTTAANTQSIRFPWLVPNEPFTQVTQSDQAELSHPWQVLLTETVRRDHELAYWNPHSFAGGVPLFANGSSGQLAPPRLLTALTVSPSTAHELSSWLHLVGAGWAVYLLMRELRARWLGGVAAGLAWQSSGFVLAWIHLEVVTPTFVYLPLLVALVHRAVRRRSEVAGLGAGLVGALLLISGHLLFALVSLMVAFGYGIALAIERIRGSSTRKAEAVRSLVTLAIPAFIAVGVAAVVLVPTALELRDSPRQPVSMEELRTIGTANPGEVFLRVGWPDALPLDADEINFQPFVGLLGAGLVLVGIVLRGRRGAGFARTLALVGLVATVEGPVMWVLHHLPLFNTFRPYGRFSLWATLGLVILLGHGADATVAFVREWLTRWPRLPAWSYLVPVVLVLAVNTGQQQSWGRGANPTFWPRTSESVLPLRPIIEAAQAGTTSTGWPQMLTPISRREPGDGFIPDTLGAELHTVFGIDTTSGYDSTVPQRTSQLVRVLEGESVEGVLATPGRQGAQSPTYGSQQVRWDLLDRLGVATVMLPQLLPPDDPTWGSPGRADALGEVRYAGADGFLVAVRGADGGPQLVSGTRIVDDDDDALRQFTDPGFDAGDTVLVTRVQARRVDELPQGGLTGSVLDTRRATNTSSVTVETEEPAWLVLPVNWHAGWSATMDGADVPVVRVNHQRVAVVVPPGQHQVDFTFRPPGLLAGAIISLASLLLVGVSWVRLRRQRSADPQPSLGE